MEELEWQNLKTFSDVGLPTTSFMESWGVEAKFLWIENAAEIADVTTPISQRKNSSKI